MSTTFTRSQPTSRAVLVEISIQWMGGCVEWVGWGGGSSSSGEESAASTIGRRPVPTGQPVPSGHLSHLSKQSWDESAEKDTFWKWTDCVGKSEMNALLDGPKVCFANKNIFQLGSIIDIWWEFKWTGQPVPSARNSELTFCTKKLVATVSSQYCPSVTELSNSSLRSKHLLHTACEVLPKKLSLKK